MRKGIGAVVIYDSRAGWKWDFKIKKIMQRYKNGGNVNSRARLTNV